MTTRRIAVALLVPLVAGCVPLSPPAASVDPMGVPITSQQIQAEMGDRYQSAGSLLLGLAGGVVGTAVGIHGGLMLAPAASQCDTCAALTVLIGAFAGLTVGVAGGGHLGLHLGAAMDRALAIERILRERARHAERPSTSCGQPPRHRCARGP